MTAVLADTHAAIWYVLASARLSQYAFQTFDAATMSGDPIFLVSVSLVEVHYLVERGRLPRTVPERLAVALRGPSAAFPLVPLDHDVADAIPLVPRAIVPDMPDRIIAATALHIHVPLVTRDSRLRSLQIETIW